MARKLDMTWQVSTRRWFKKHRGKMYTVSCRQFGCPDTKEGSVAAANAWWDALLKEIEAAPPSEEDGKPTPSNSGP